MFVEHLPDDRGQAHTLEAFTAALLLVTGLIFATQATAVTPLSASTSNQHVENQAAIAAQDVLSTAGESGDLRAALLYYDEDGFVNASDDGTYTGVPPESHPLHDPLTEAFGDRQIAFDIEVSYPEDGGNRTGDTTMVNMGSPSDNAATATARVALYGDDRFGDGADSRALAENGSASYFAPPVDEARPEVLYTVVEVRITAWQM
ncbi:hypothetical protein C463_07317 [Halorubrum californiense DSM 19288]|uniref:Uncharacterized protein n=1 Tax=Halorubrum californiense DSM 19288 TaxID=1227465 RepID=M0EAB7_9EURY|nr:MULTISPECIES: hypothetical protein [Halorubrum]ELZ44746.1 hypothetical protein C463_07317 [Halorubrum californiense DSM 19288]TKX71783.1 hypothetical protein EXE40_06860 [Halorubrum sp. GN11GM_10-3_MGM]